MSHTRLEREELVAAADQARERTRRRRMVRRMLSLLALLGVVAIAVVCTVAFTNSWWMKRGVPASPDQRASDGSSVFTQAGIDYLTKQGVMHVRMDADRPQAPELGLPASGKRHLDLLVPVTVEVEGTEALGVDAVGSVDVVTSGGTISALELPSDGAYADLLQQVQDLAPRMGWSSSDLERFTTRLQASRAAHDFTAYSATIGPADTDGMRVSATLKADPSHGPTLILTFRPQH